MSILVKAFFVALLAMIALMTIAENYIPTLDEMAAQQKSNAKASEFR